MTENKENPERKVMRQLKKVVADITEDDKEFYKTLLKKTKRLNDAMQTIIDNRALSPYLLNDVEGILKEIQTEYPKAFSFIVDYFWKWEPRMGTYDKVRNWEPGKRFE